MPAGGRARGRARQGGRRASSSARPTCRSRSATGRATTRSTASPTTLTISAARPAARPGGSSAALAAGYGALSLGSDIGGSLRVPAHYCGVYAHKPTYAWCPSRGHTPPPFPPLPLERDLVGDRPDGARRRRSRRAARRHRRARRARGRRRLPAWRCRRRATRALRTFRVLLLDTHPLLPTSASVRGAIGDARRRPRPGRRRRSRARATCCPTWRRRAALYADAAVVPGGDVRAARSTPARRPRRRRLDPAITSLAAERLRGATLSHRDWVVADGARARLRAQWRHLFRRFDAVDLPGDADAGLSARSFRGPGSAPHFDRRHRYPYLDQLVVARRRDAAGPAGDRRADRPLARGPADRRADHRPVAGGSHAAAARRADRARVRRLRCCRRCSTTEAGRDP